jgi:hypothetical protein
MIRLWKAGRTGYKVPNYLQHLIFVVSQSLLASFKPDASSQATLSRTNIFLRPNNLIIIASLLLGLARLLLRFGFIAFVMSPPPMVAFLRMGFIIYTILLVYTRRRYPDDGKRDRTSCYTSKFLVDVRVRLSRLGILIKWLLLGRLFCVGGLG